MPSASPPSDSRSGAVAVLLSENPYRALDRERGWLQRGIWPCFWVAVSGCGNRPSVTAYRCRFVVEEETSVRLHVAADERYELFLDGKRIGRGSERGDPSHWFFDTYDLALAPGRHLLAARVWALGAAAPRSQMTVRPGFLLSPQEEPWIARVGTGVAEWEGRLLGGYSFTPPFDHSFYSIGHNVRLDGAAFPWDWEQGEGAGWSPVQKLHPGSDAIERTRVGEEHLLRFAMLPARIAVERAPGRVRFSTQVKDDDFRHIAIREGDNLPELQSAWNSLWRQGEPLSIPPHTVWRILIDLEEYLCAYPVIETSGGRGSRLHLHWAESLFLEPTAKTKGDRNQIDGKYFFGVGDEFFPGGDGEAGRTECFEPPFWRAGRYLEIAVSTSQEPLILRRIAPLETRYPFEPENALTADDERWNGFAALAVRTLRASCHDGYVDPYYEQMMWAGDGVQTVLTTFVLTADDRLPRKLLSSFDGSRLPSGFTRARHPARDALLIAPYSLCWVQMIREFAFWRGDAGFVRNLMIGARGVLDAFGQLVQEDGLLGAPPGWNFIDWVPEWKSGTPPDADRGICSILHWHFILALMTAAATEEALGEVELASRDRRRARELAESAVRAFWCEKRGLFADDVEKTRFSEHAQAYAILSGCVAPVPSDRIRHGLLHDPDLVRTTISFSHYLFEAYRRLGCIEALFVRMEQWFGLESLGLMTLPEAPEPSRSDCHAWSTHPLYHFHASVMGIRPVAMGFRRVAIRPQLGPLQHVAVRVPHPEGFIAVELRRESGALSGTVTLPATLEGIFSCDGQEVPLHGGTQKIQLTALGS
jgi:alpha-L-rhamnosidase